MGCSKLIDGTIVNDVKDEGIIIKDNNKYLFILIINKYNKEKYRVNSRLMWRYYNEEGFKEKLLEKQKQSIL